MKNIVKFYPQWIRKYFENVIFIADVVLSLSNAVNNKVQRWELSENSGDNKSNGNGHLRWLLKTISKIKLLAIVYKQSVESSREVIVISIWATWTFRGFININGFRVTMWRLLNTSFKEVLGKFHIISNFNLKNAQFVQTNGSSDMHTHARVAQCSPNCKLDSKKLIV